MLAPKEDAEIAIERGERRLTRRAPVAVPARLRSGDLILEGVVKDASTGGVFLSTNLLIEVGERGELLVGEHEVRVQVVWLRGNAHAEGPGMGLVFEENDPHAPRVMALLGV